MKVMLDPGAIMPTKAHTLDAGLDLYARETQIVSAKESAKFDTGVHIAIPAGYAGVLMSKSGLNTNHGITSTGLIDSGYTGSIVVKLYNHSGFDYKVEAGEKISQIVFVPILSEELELTDSLEKTERGNNGFGSSGKFKNGENIKNGALCNFCEFEFYTHCMKEGCGFCVQLENGFCNCLSISEGQHCPYYKEKK